MPLLVFRAKRISIVIRIQCRVRQPSGQNGKLEAISELTWAAWEALHEQVAQDVCVRSEMTVIKDDDAMSRPVEIRNWISAGDCKISG